jgi:aspartyl-tRNA(Asn)/glutamyl-tRNA(Gln) amidotransferase subunit B
MEVEIIIGLEIHLQLKTKSKMFCGCSNEGENEPANTTICPICTGQPGTLPVINEEAINLGLLMSLGLNSKINKESVFERKNYFYPDLPKGYQISQFEKPLASDGYVIINIEGKAKRINLERLHLEEDAAKNFHDGDNTLVDFNRCGTPLAEIVTKPDIASPKEARIFLQELRLVACYLGVSSADMEKGHLRCDANISLRPMGENKLYPKTEVKNLNSFKSVERALEYEIKRQTELWEKKIPPADQSTRGWDEARGITIEQRTKEESSDYRYFPEPDLPTLVVDQKMIARVKARLIELPAAKRKRFIKEYDLPLVDASILIEDINISHYFENTISELRGWLMDLEGQEGTAEEIWERSKKKLVKLVYGWLTSELFKLMNVGNKKIIEIKITPENFAEFITIIYQNKVNSTAAQILLKQMYETGGDPSQIIEEKDLKQVDDSGELDKVIDKIIVEHPNEVNQYRGGKLPLIKFFIGLVMRETKGKANPQKTEELLIQKLS